MTAHHRSLRCPTCATLALSVFESVAPCRHCWDDHARDITTGLVADWCRCDNPRCTMWALVPAGTVCGACGGTHTVTLAMIDPDGWWLAAGDAHPITVAAWRERAEHLLSQFRAELASLLSVDESDLDALIADRGQP